MYTLILKILFCMMRINTLWGDETDILAKSNLLLVGCKRCKDRQSRNDKLGVEHLKTGMCTTENRQAMKSCHVAPIHNQPRSSQTSASFFKIKSNIFPYTLIQKSSFQIMKTYNLPGHLTAVFGSETTTVPDAPAEQLLDLLS